MHQEEMQQIIVDARPPARAPTLRSSLTIFKDKVETTGTTAEKRLVDKLDEWDINGDGHFSAEEVFNAVKFFVAEQQKVKNLKKVLAIGSVVGALVLVILLCMILAGNEISKDSRPDQVGVQTTNAGAPVATASVKKVVPLADYASLSDEELSNVENVAFKRSTNLHMFRVSGFVRRGADAVDLHLSPNSIATMVSIDKKVAKLTLIDGTTEALPAAKRRLASCASDSSTGDSGSGYDQSLTACKAVAAQFRNTCDHGDYDTPAASMETMKSTTVECTDNRRCIAAGVKTGGTCAWERKLCMTCRDDNGVTKIRFQSNNLPDHCVSPGNNLVQAKNFDFEVIFNKKHTPGEFVQNFATQEELDDAVCPISKQRDEASLGLVEYGDTESRMAAGFAINGVAFQFANSISEDPASPITVTNEQPLDMCLGHNQQNSDSGMYHYHHLTPCLNEHFLADKKASECTAQDECKNDISGWSRSGYDSTKYRTIVGIAKFGHVMYGPYKNSGELWGANEVDPCNGAWSGDEFFYVGTAWHPYVIGCQGPTNLPQNSGMFPQCSTNGIDKYVTEGCEAASAGAAVVTGSVSIQAEL